MGADGDATRLSDEHSFFFKGGWYSYTTGYAILNNILICNTDYVYGKITLRQEEDGRFIVIEMADKKHLNDPSIMKYGLGGTYCKEKKLLKIHFMKIDNSTKWFHFVAMREESDGRFTTFYHD